MEQRILVVVDIQNDFCDKGGILYHPNCGEVADRIAQVVVKEIDAGTKVLFSLDSHWWGEYGGTKEAEEFPLHTEVGKAGERSFLSIITLCQRSIFLLPHLNTASQIL